MASSTTQRTARATARLTRPLARLDPAAFDPLAVDLTVAAHGYDPLAPVHSAWSAASAPEQSPAVAAAPVPHPALLRDLAERARVQVTSLRTALDEAARLDRALAARANELSHRIAQGTRFEQEMDRRLTAAGRASEVLDQAAGALRGLERVIAELHSTQANAEATFRQALEAQETRIHQKLAEHEARIARMIENHAEVAALKLGEQSEAFAARLMELDAQNRRAMDGAQVSAAAAEAHAMRISAGIERSVKAEADRLASALERQGAQVQARVGMVIDDATQRVIELEARAQRAGQSAAQRLETLCGRAAQVLGHDPLAGAGSTDSRPAPGSLAEIADRAEAAGRAGDETVMRLAVAADRAVEVEVKLAAAVREASQITADREFLDQAIATEARLAGLRDDLESVATSVRYNLSQAQQSEAILGKTIDRARDKVQSLDRAMDEVTQQAGSMVQVARDVAGLVRHAEHIKGELVESLAQAAAASPGAVATPDQSEAAGRIRRAPFGPPHPHGEDTSAAAA